MLDLNLTRENIDKIDNQIVKLFEERMELASKVADYKRATGKQVFDKEREMSKLDTLQGLVTDERNRYPVKELFTQIMSMSRKRQYALLESYAADLSFLKTPELPLSTTDPVVFFGEEGSYSQVAMEEYFGEHVKCFARPTFKQVMEAVNSGEAAYGVLPIENSSTGGVLDTYDLLLDYRNYIVGEHVVKIDHALLGLPGANIDDIKNVYSHPQGIMQCHAFFESRPDITCKQYMSTSASAKKVLEDGDITKAAIASKRAAKCYNLQILKEKLNTESTNSTRFIIITNQKIFLENANKVSICFELPHESGSLYNMLSHFIYNNLNLTKIESRPIPGRNWEYRFFVDVSGNLQDAGMKNAINGIKEEATNVRILGNYITV
ncbi:MAG: prephenate dehydratase [Lachnospiraceae bacterium]|nr:prephenate dehydratase [Lachnospiraceae bacterium]